MTLEEAEEELEALQGMASQFSSLRIEHALRQNIRRMEVEFDNLWSPKLICQMHNYCVSRWLSQLYRRWAEKLYLERSQEYSILLYMARRMYDDRDPQLLDKYKLTLLRWFRTVAEINLVYTVLYGHTARGEALLRGPPKAQNNE